MLRHGEDDRDVRSQGAGKPPHLSGLAGGLLPDAILL